MNAVLSHLDALLAGLRLTTIIAVAGFTLALAVGTLLAVLRVSPVGTARHFSAVLTEVLRNCPLPVLFVLFVFGLPKAGIIYPLVLTSIVVLGLYTGAYVAEALRSGINTVGTGQAEAARAIGLGYLPSLRLVILPQAFRAVLPPLGNLLIACAINSSIAATVGVVELTGAADLLNTRIAQPLPVFLIAGLGYVLLTLPLGLLVGRAERGLRVAR